VPRSGCPADGSRVARPPAPGRSPAEPVAAWFGGPVACRPGRSARRPGLADPGSALRPWSADLEDGAGPDRVCPVVPVNIRTEIGEPFGSMGAGVCHKVLITWRQRRALVSQARGTRAGGRRSGRFDGVRDDSGTSWTASAAKRERSTGALLDRALAGRGGASHEHVLDDPPSGTTPARTLMDPVPSTEVLSGSSPTMAEPASPARPGGRRNRNGPLAWGGGAGRPRRGGREASRSSARPRRSYSA